MVPANEETEQDSSVNISEQDILTVIQLAKNGLISADGILLDSRKKPISGCKIYSCLLLKSRAKNYNKYLEIKASLNKKPGKSNKRKKSDSEWSDDED